MPMKMARHRNLHLHLFLLLVVFILTSHQVSAISRATSTATSTATAHNCTISQYLGHNGKCVEFSSAFEKASTDYSATLDSGNTAWMLMSGALVMIMTPGVAFFYAGLAGEEMASNTLMMSFVSMALVSIVFFAYGYSGAFGEKTFGWAAYRNVTGLPGVYGDSKIPNIAFAFFQTQFATITPALLSGGIVGRMKFGSYMLFIFLWSSLVYVPLAHWIWSWQLNDQDFSVEPMGWEAQMGSLDFAGGTVIHISSGFGALVAAIMVGKRYNYYEQLKPHNVPLVMLGATLLWFGWFGFNAGSATAAGGTAAIAAMNTHLSASTGFLTWMALEWMHDERVDPSGSACGAIAGLVCITPGCGYVMPWASVIFGFTGAVCSFYAVRTKNKLRYDDTLDAFGIHGVSGMVGGILTGIFASKEVSKAEGALYGNWTQLKDQLIAQVVAVSYTCLGTFLILFVLKFTVGLRTTKDKLRQEAYHHHQPHAQLASQSEVQTRSQSQIPTPASVHVPSRQHQQQHPRSSRTHATKPIQMQTQAQFQYNYQTGQIQPVFDPEASGASNQVLSRPYSHTSQRISQHGTTSSTTEPSPYPAIPTNTSRQYTAPPSPRSMGSFATTSLDDRYSEEYSSW